MSFILLPQHQVNLSVIKNIKDTPSTLPKPLSPSHTHFPHSNVKNAQFQLLKQVVNETHAQHKYMRIMTKNLQSNWCITANIKLSKQRQAVSINFCILNKEQVFWKITNLRSLPQLSFKINNILKNFNQILISVSFNWDTGEVLIKLPLYRLDGFLSRLKTDSLSQFIYNAHLRRCLWLAEFIVKEGNCQTANKNKIIENMNRYCQMMHINHHFNESRVQTQSQIVIKDKMKRESIKRRVKHKVSHQAWQNTNQLYAHQNSLDRLIPTEQSHFFLQEEQTKYICGQIAMPVQAKPKNPFENLMVLNFISVHNLSHLRLTKINNGGFSTIYQTEIKFQYVYSTQDHQSLHPNEELTSDQSIKQKKILYKYVIVKIEDEIRSNSRNLHQIAILKQIKNASCIYLPKYYVVANKINPYEKAIFMDYISPKNLSQFMRDCQSSISLLTKLYLIYSIVQSLRYIRDYRIVHLDLKPNNVMIFGNMLIKLIDFGQSYHPDVCSKKHLPGYTLPYSSPEIFDKQPHTYTSKSDVFSLGVIIFQMLYRSSPYDIYEQTENVDDAMKQYLQKWYFTPQEYSTYGEINAIKLLNLIISKCLSPSPSSRPQLDWIALLIKQCFLLMN